MTAPHMRVGIEGENIAADYLQAHGYTIVDRNWRCAAGELDIVALREGVAVIVEVKTRTSTVRGRPMEAIDLAKQRRLRRLARQWLVDRECNARSLRIDAVLVMLTAGAPDIEHRQGIA